MAAGLALLNLPVRRPRSFRRLPLSFYPYRQAPKARNTRRLVVDLAAPGLDAAPPVLTSGGVSSNPGWAWLTFLRPLVALWINSTSALQRIWRVPVLGAILLALSTQHAFAGGDPVVTQRQQALLVNSGNDEAGISNRRCTALTLY